MRCGQVYLMGLSKQGERKKNKWDLGVSQVIEEGGLPAPEVLNANANTC